MRTDKDAMRDFLFPILIVQAALSSALAAQHDDIPIVLPGVTDQSLHDGGSSVNGHSGNEASISEIFKRVSTLEILCKTSETIVFADIETVQQIESSNLLAGEAYSIRLNPHETLYGAKQEKPINAIMPYDANWPSDKAPVKGLLVIAFLSDKEYDFTSDNVTSWSFDRRAATNTRTYPNQRVLCGGRGLIDIAGNEGSNILQVVKGYLGHLSRPDRDTVAYFWFLNGLLGSEIPRIRDDALVDITRLLKEFEDDKRKQLLDEPAVHPLIRVRVR